MLLLFLFVCLLLLFCFVLFCFCFVFVFCFFFFFLGGGGCVCVGGGGVLHVWAMVIIQYYYTSDIPERPCNFLIKIPNSKIIFHTVFYLSADFQQFWCAFYNKLALNNGKKIFCFYQIIWNYPRKCIFTNDWSIGRTYVHNGPNFVPIRIYSSCHIILLYRYTYGIKRVVSIQNRNDLSASWQNQQNDICAQRIIRSAWTCAQSDQRLRCTLNG